MWARPKSVTQSWPLVVDQQVGRFDVAVQDPALVGVLECLGRLDAQPGHGLDVVAVARRRVGKGPDAGAR